MPTVPVVSGSVEDYLKTVLKLEDENLRATTSQIARRLEVADPSVTDMCQRLQRAGLLRYQPYRGVKLTDRGRALALRILRRHRLIELFLQRVMGYGWAEVHPEAEKLEHVVSDLFVDRIDELLNHPTQDPHGESIPDAAGLRNPRGDTCLAEAPLGEYTVERVVKHEPAFLSYLETLHLVPSGCFHLTERLPFGGPLKVVPGGDRTPRYIGLEAAGSIFVIPRPSADTKFLKGRPKAQPPSRSRMGRAAGTRTFGFRTP